MSEQIKVAGRVINFFKPVIIKGSPKCCVYRMWVEGKHFYIGSTTDLPKRMQLWKKKLVSGDFNKKIAAVICNANRVDFEILEFAKSEIAVRKREFMFLKEFSSYIFSLNVSSEAICLKSKKIARFDTAGNLLQIHPSKESVFKKFKACKPSMINLHLNGKRRVVGGFTFKLVSEDGSFLDRVPYTKKRVAFTQKSGVTVPLFYQINSDGEIVGEFTNFQKAGESIGLVYGHAVKYSVENKVTKTVKGFKFIYASEYFKNEAAKQSL